MQQQRQNVTVEADERKASSLRSKQPLLEFNIECLAYESCLITLLNLPMAGYNYRTDGVYKVFWLSSDLVFFGLVGISWSVDPFD